MGLDIYSVTQGMGAKVWWICPKSECGSSFDMRISHKINGISCPFCAGKRVNDTNSLLTLRPNLAKEWHPIKNGDLTPHDVPIFSSKKIWWICELGHEWQVIVGTRSRKNSGCPYCSGYKVFVGFNDLRTTRPDCARLLANPDDGYKYAQGSNKKVNWICSACDTLIKKRTIGSITRYGLACPSCSDGKSYGAKFMYNLLKYSNMSFKPEATFEWSKNYFYDFYLGDYNWIIETHGKQHYENNRKNSLWRTLEEEQENDRKKKEIAKLNNIDKYIVIDTRKSDFNFIKANIENSELKKLIDFDSVDWIRIEVESVRSWVKIVWGLYAEGLSLKQIAEEMKLSQGTVSSYLRKGHEIGKFDYYKRMKEENTKRGKQKRKPIVQLSLNGDFIKEWDSLIDIQEVSDKTINNVQDCCSGHQKTAYGFRWAYKEDYDLIGGKVGELIYDTGKAVIQLSIDGDFINGFKSVTEAKYQTGCSGISEVCRGISSHSGGFLWLFKEDYEVFTKENLPDRNIKKKRVKYGSEVAQMTTDDVKIKIWGNVTEASKGTGIKETNIYRSCHGTRKSAGGFKWKYIEDNSELKSI
jgi:predicted DNA-binding protein YlxM (UPF0122 family)